MSWLVPSLLVLAFATVMVAWAMHRDFNHDEHQFLAPGALLSQQGQLPYRDYPIFHLPNLTFIYAGANWLIGAPTMAARLVSAVSSAIIGLLLVLACYRSTALRPWRGLMATLVLMLLLLDPLFGYTSGKCWNHETATMFALLGTVLAIASGNRANCWLALAAGICGGLAVGTRLTLAPLLVALSLCYFLLPGWSRRAQFQFAAIFSAGTLVGLLPSLICFLMAPEQFIFGNLQFPRLRLLDPTNERIQKTVTWWRKGRFFIKEVMLPSWPLFLAFFIFALRPAWTWLRRKEGGSFANAVILLASTFVLVGCFSPSRYQYQHCFALIPFLALGLIYGAESARALFTRRAWITPAVFGAVCLSSALMAWFRNDKNEKMLDARWLADLAEPAKWFPLRVHELGQILRDKVGAKGKVLTLAPSWVTEGGLQIYPEFAAGPFAWKSASLLAPEKRQRLQMVAPEDLETFLAKDPPAAILTGVEDPSLEQPLEDYAKAHGYQPVKVSKKWQLWLPAKAEAVPSE